MDRIIDPNTIERSFSCSTLLPSFISFSTREFTTLESPPMMVVMCFFIGNTSRLKLNSLWKVSPRSTCCSRLVEVRALVYFLISLVTIFLDYLHSVLKCRLLGVASVLQSLISLNTVPSFFFK